MTNMDSRPQFALYVVWHSDFALGDRVACGFRRHWSTDPYRQIVDGGGIDVLRDTPATPAPCLR